MSYSTDWISQAKLEAMVSPSESQFVAGFNKLDFTGGDAARDTVTARSATEMLGTFGPPLGRAWICHSIDIAGDQAIRGYLRIDEITTIAAASGASSYQQLYLGFGLPIGQTNIPLHDRVLYEQSLIRPTFVAETGVTTLPFSSIGLHVTQITGDLNFGAPYVIGMMGHSAYHTIPGDYSGVAVGGGKPRGDHLAMFRVRDSLRAAGVDCRLFNPSFGGASAAQWCAFLRQGRYRSTKVDVWHLDTAFNDLGSTAGEADASQLLWEEIMRWMRSTSPKCDIILHHMGPSDSAEKIAKRSAFRTRLEATQATFGGTANGVYIADLANAFSNTSATEFASTEGAGSKIHPNILGQRGYAEIIRPVYATTRFFRDHREFSGALVEQSVAIA